MDVYNQFLKDIPDAIKYYPELSQIEGNGGRPILSGYVNLIEDNGEVLDRYQIEICPSADYPNKYPFVYEIGGRIPHNIDWHVYPDGHFCIAVPVKERLDCIEGVNLKSFIEKQIIPFLFNQTFRRNNGYFYKEQAHGLLGRLEFYQEYLGLHDLNDAIVSMQIIAGGFELGSDAKCFCESGKKFKKCHRRILRSLEKKAGDLVKNDYKEFKTILASQKKAPR